MTNETKPKRGEQAEDGAGEPASESDAEAVVRDVAEQVAEEVEEEIAEEVAEEIAEEVEEEVAEEVEEEVAEAVEEEVGETDQAIATLETELIEVKDQMLRAVAEAENIRKRAQKQTEDAHKYANAGFARGLLSVADNLRRAIEAVPQEEISEDQLLANLLDGVGAVERELLSVFEQHNIERIEPLGEAFDPNLHQAMFELESADEAPGTIVQLMAPGYVLNGRLLRAAMVVVAKAPAEATTEDKEQTTEENGEESGEENGEEESG